ncbi:Chemotaxis protein methyltransferase [Gemmata obscuriglobus]|uniref:protein-glutamate O-methyltransferase n=1 Tax=Gemmata obscuriglobus TaxID=114 RepID=A0A2Z3GT00_9BACT|nr:protein-glutamate O-methyltransferase CheR [Gemmata obscuriglobus]AWM36398.1 protein-glutamate O-methyltransferase CheR [Gemmata obscuriglobus]QEG30987.1 Chemotaxis protein methyltransferase [Gemmata obscuriglobus]VTS10322.1 chemotaxis protein : Chemotaxis protein methyltransferase OS=Desulfovibrio gigas DSM 1382 = ATCC 19364 GN=DGI_3247 PE=4 SV=1: CheR_N: CheR [Gemmata obscuriglobus UQM 2246]
MDLPPEEFALIRDLIYARTGLMFEDKKRLFLAPRVSRRVRAARCSGPRDYYHLLRYSDPDGREFQELVDEVTTNETYFFRDYPQLEFFANEVLPRVADAKRAARDHSLNVWSACCSTGDEPYTLAIILAACLDDFSRWDVKLVGTDIDTKVLATARAAVYGERNVKDVDPSYLGRYFVPTRGGYRVADPIRRMVAFERVNLVDDDRMSRQRGFDFIFCRNALIYFDDASRKRVLASFHDALRPGGFVFLGHSESVGRISRAFEPVQFGPGGVAYRKPGGHRLAAAPT